MPPRKTSAPLTPASERRMGLRARSILDEAARRSYLDKHVVTIAAGLLLRIANHTGETAQALMTRLRIPESRRYLIVRCGSRAETYKGDKPPPIIRRFLEINKTKPSCVRGRQCTCTQILQRVRCGNYRRGDPSLLDKGAAAERWTGEGCDDPSDTQPRQPRVIERGGSDARHAR